MTSVNFSSVMNHICLGTTFLHSDVEGASRGISIVYNSNTMAGLEGMKDKNLLIMDYKTNNEKWGLINIYASNSRVGRKETYEKLERIVETMKDK